MLELLPNSDHVHDLLPLLSQKKTAHLTLHGILRQAAEEAGMSWEVVHQDKYLFYQANELCSHAINCTFLTRI